MKVTPEQAPWNQLFRPPSLAELKKVLTLVEGDVPLFSLLLLGRAYIPYLDSFTLLTSCQRSCQLLVPVFADAENIEVRLTLA